MEQPKDLNKSMVVANKEVLNLVQNRPDVRLGVIKCVDVILATLQAAFSQDKLFNGGNPFKFNRDDPKMSRVWVCDPQSRLGEHDGNRMMVMVSRGEYTPAEMHFYNKADANMSDRIGHMDLASTPIYIQCEAGTKTMSETLASVVYNILKIFRLDIMREYDIFSIKLLGISVATQQKEVPGEPWVTNVTGRLEVQEDSTTFEFGNHLNKLVIEAELQKNLTREIASLDTKLPDYQPGVMPPVLPKPAGKCVKGETALQQFNGVSPLTEQNFPVEGN